MFDDQFMGFSQDNKDLMFDDQLLGFTHYDKDPDVRQSVPSPPGRGRMTRAPVGILRGAGRR